MFQNILIRVNPKINESEKRIMIISYETKLVYGYFSSINKVSTKIWHHDSKETLDNAKFSTDFRYFNFLNVKQNLFNLFFKYKTYIIAGKYPSVGTVFPC